MGKRSPQQAITKKHWAIRFLEWLNSVPDWFDEPVAYIATAGDPSVVPGCLTGQLRRSERRCRKLAVVADTVEIDFDAWCESGDVLIPFKLLSGIQELIALAQEAAPGVQSKPVGRKVSAQLQTAMNAPIVRKGEHP